MWIELKLAYQELHGVGLNWWQRPLLFILILAVVPVLVLYDLLRDSLWSYRSQFRHPHHPSTRYEFIPDEMNVPIK